MLVFFAFKVFNIVARAFWVSLVMIFVVFFGFCCNILLMCNVVLFVLSVFNSCNVLDVFIWFFFFSYMCERIGVVVFGGSVSKYVDI